MMMRLMLIGAVALLAACESEPLPPSPEMVALQSACQEGDTQACAVIAQLNQQAAIQRQQAAMILMQNTQPQPIDPTLFQVRQPMRTVCQNQFGVQVVCTTQ